MLHINELSVFSCRDNPLLYPVTFSLKRGEITGVVGESGSGKSILAHALLGHAPTGFRVEGEIIGQSQFALAAQSAGILDPLKTVWQHLFRWRGGSKATSEKLTSLGIDREIAGCYRHQLSGGMGKRALLAHALVQSPDFVLADEPCAGIDDIAATQMYQQLRQKADTENLGILLITHNLRQLVKWADHILVIKEGRLVEKTTPAKITEGNCHPYTSSLWQALPENWELNRIAEDKHVEAA